MNIHYLATVRKFALDAVTDARHAPEAVRRELEAKYQRADAQYRRVLFGRRKAV